MLHLRIHQAGILTCHAGEQAMPVQCFESLGQDALYWDKVVLHISLSILLAPFVCL